MTTHTQIDTHTPQFIYIGMQCFWDSTYVRHLPMDTSGPGTAGCKDIGSWTQRAMDTSGCRTQRTVHILSHGYSTRAWAQWAVDTSGCRTQRTVHILSHGYSTWARAQWAVNTSGCGHSGRWTHWVVDNVIWTLNKSLSHTG